MDLFAVTIDEFGRHLGLPSLSPGPEDCVELTIEQAGRLQIEKKGDNANIILARPRTPHAANVAGAALDLSHWRENHPWHISAGMKGEDWLVFIAKMPLTHMDVPTLDRALTYLSDLHDRVEKTGVAEH